MRFVAVGLQAFCWKRWKVKSEIPGKAISIPEISIIRQNPWKTKQKNYVKIVKTADEQTWIFLVPRAIARQ